MELLRDILEFFRSYPIWARWILGLSSAAIVLTLVIAPREMQVKSTGDPMIDAVLKRLRDVEPHDDTARIDALRALFDRPAFFVVPEQGWRYLLFPQCATRLILQQNKSDFDSPKIRQTLQRVIRQMYELQIDVSKEVFGEEFSLDNHIRKHIGDAERFTYNLPKEKHSPDDEFLEQRNLVVQKTRNELASIGLID